MLLEVGDQRQRALAGQFMNQLGTVYGYHLSAFGLEPPAHAAANALGRAGDQRDLALESVAHLCSPQRRLRLHAATLLPLAIKRGQPHPHDAASPQGNSGRGGELLVIEVRR